MYSNIPFEEFLSKHMSALEKDQPRHNLFLGIINRAKADPSAVRYWSLGEGAACAIQTPPNFLVLGDLSKKQCDEFAKIIQKLDFIGCLGSGDSAERLAQSLTEMGIIHALEVPQRIYVLEKQPKYPDCEGQGRKYRPQDRDLFCDWFYHFSNEATPHETAPEKERIKKMFADIPVFFWVVDGKPVSMASINRETKDGSNISFVFTPPELRGRGYAGSVTAYACENAFKEGKKICFLYTDLRNPISNKVYQKIGFYSWCDSKIYKRVNPAGG